MTTGDTPITPGWNFPTGKPCQPGRPAFSSWPPLFWASSTASKCTFGSCAASIYPRTSRSFHIGCSKVANPAADELLHFLHYPADIASTVALCKKLQLFLRLGKRLSVHTDIGTANRQLRKVTKAKSVFPTDDSLLKMLYLAMMDITKKWTGRRQDWSVIHTQLAVFFADRMLD